MQLVSPRPIFTALAVSVAFAFAGTTASRAQLATPPLPPVDIASPEDVLSEAAAHEHALLPPAHQSGALNAAQGMADLLDGAGGGVSRDELLAALESAADAGQPIALWRLGVMYENGEGVQKDEVKAFSYYSRIANDNANTPPRSLEADIVAQSFLKVGEYFRKGLPDAGIKQDSDRSHALMMHAATYFGDADAQYQVGKLFLDENELGRHPLQSARWLSLAARKGHPSAQALLGELLFNGEGLERQPIEGLMWLSIAYERARGTDAELEIQDKLNTAMSVATPEQRASAVEAAKNITQRLAYY